MYNWPFIAVFYWGALSLLCANDDAVRVSESNEDFMKESSLRAVVIYFGSVCAIMPYSTSHTSSSVAFLCTELNWGWAFRLAFYYRFEAFFKFWILNLIFDTVVEGFYLSKSKEEEKKQEWRLCDIHCSIYSQTTSARFRESLSSL